MSKELKGKIRKGIFWVIGSNVLTIGCQLLSVAVLARMLNPSDFGLQAIGLLILDVFAVFTYPFINKAIVLRKEVDNDFLTSATVLSSILSLIIAALFFLSSKLLASFFENENVAFVISVISLIFIIRGIYQPYNSHLERELLFKEISNYNLIAFLIGYLLVPLILARAGYGFKSLILGLLASEVILMLLILIKVRLRIGTFRLRHITELFADSRNLILQTLGNRIATNGDQFIISKFLGIDSLGYYSRAYKIMKMPTTFIGNVINKVSFASLAQINENDEKLRKAFIFSSFALALFSFPIFFTTLIFTDEIVLILLGPQWINTGSTLQILAFGIYLRMAFKVPWTILKVKQKFGVTARIQIIYALSVIGFSFMLISFDIEGIAVGALLALILQYILMIYEVNKCVHNGLGGLFKVTLSPLLFALGFTILLLTLDQTLKFALPMNGVNSFIISVCITTLLSGFVLLKFGYRIFGEPFEWWRSFLAAKKKI